MRKTMTASIPEISSGTPVFAGARAALKNLTDCINAGGSVDAFLEDFPTVSRAQVISRFSQKRVSADNSKGKFGKPPVVGMRTKICLV